MPAPANRNAPRIGLAGFAQAVQLDGHGVDHVGVVHAVGAVGAKVLHGVALLHQPGLEGFLQGESGVIGGKQQGGGHGT